MTDKKSLEDIQVENIKKMEDILNKMSDSITSLFEACEKWEQLLPDFRRLMNYYHSEQWHIDRELCDHNKLPKGMTCGVLSEDAVYNLYGEQRALALYLAKTAIKALE